MAAFIQGTSTTLGSLTFDPADYNLHKYTITSSSGTVNMTTGGLDGQPMWLSVFNNSGSLCILGYTGSCKVTGSALIPAGKTLTQHFISDGTYMWASGQTII